MKRKDTVTVITPHESSLEQKAVEVWRRGVAEHRRSFLMGLSQVLAPAAVFAQLWSQYIPTRQERRQQEFLSHDLPAAVDKVRKQVNELRILTDPYADLWEDVMSAVVTRRGLDKRAFYAAVLANALLDDAPEQAMQERMLSILDDLRPSHLRLLAHVVRDLAKPSSTGMQRKGVYVTLWDGADEYIVRRDWDDLVALGILKGRDAVDPTSPSGWAQGMKNRLVPLSHVGEQAYLSATITPFGETFAAFVGVDGNEARS